jgi:hypothetical protein
MSLKGLILLVPLAMGGWYVASGSGGSFSREVDRTPAQVAEAIADLDIRRQPGTPGADPSASGGVRPTFRTERTEDGISFVVWSGDQVATRMIAHLEPLDGGRRTRITAKVERGDAPDEIVSPAFRSTGITLGLFTAALGDELDDLLSPPRRSRAECQQLEERLLTANAPANGNPIATIRTVTLVGRELRRQGCDTRARANEPFAPMSNEMGDPPSHAPSPAVRTSRDGVNFEPGRPMVDVSTKGR